MFTGIVKTTAPIINVEKSDACTRLTIALDPAYLQGLQLGASLAINGVCLSVVAIENNHISFEAIQETLTLSTLGKLKENNIVHVERSAKIGDEIGGHLLSGHIHTQAKLIDITEKNNDPVFHFALDETWMKYLFPKGYIAIDGCSLTVVSVQSSNFTVHLIPETLRTTQFGSKKIGDCVNIEIDQQTRTIVDTVENLLHQGE